MSSLISSSRLISKLKFPSDGAYYVADDAP